MSNQFGTTNRIALGIVPEVDYGVTPSNPEFQPVRILSESLKFNIDTEKSDEIREDRMTSDLLQLGGMNEGDISCEFSFAGAYDYLFQCAFKTDPFELTGTPVTIDTASLAVPSGANKYYTISGASGATGSNLIAGQAVKVTGFADDFFAIVHSVTATQVRVFPAKADLAGETGTSDVVVTPLPHMRNGLIQPSFTAQKTHGDLATPKYSNFTGCVVNKWDLDVTAKAKITQTFSVMGSDGDQVTTQFAGATTGEKRLDPVMTASRNAGFINFDGDATRRYFFTTFKVSLDNADRSRDAVGEFSIIGVVPSRIQPTGELEIYMEDNSQFERFKNNEEFSLTIPLIDKNGNGYILHMPRCKYDDFSETTGGLDQDVFAAGNFVALVDEGGEFAIQLSRVTA